MVTERRIKSLDALLKKEKKYRHLRLRPSALLFAVILHITSVKLAPNLTTNVITSNFPRKY